MKKRAARKKRTGPKAKPARKPRIHIVRLMKTEDRPPKPHVRRGDIVVFVNLTGARSVTLKYDPRSPFKTGNGAEDIKIRYAKVKHVWSGSRVGSYLCEKSAAVGGPPDGPSVVVDG